MGENNKNVVAAEVRNGRAAGAWLYGTDSTSRASGPSIGRPGPVDKPRFITTFTFNLSPPPLAS